MMTSQSIPGAGRKSEIFSILKAASSLVRNNRHRKEKVLWCNNEAGERLEFFEGLDDGHEAAYVARKIVELKLNDYALSLSMRP